MTVTVHTTKRNAYLANKKHLYLNQNRATAHYPNIQSLFLSANTIFSENEKLPCFEKQTRKIKIKALTSFVSLTENAINVM